MVRWSAWRRTRRRLWIAHGHAWRQHAHGMGLGRVDLWVEAVRDGAIHRGMHPGRHAAAAAAAAARWRPERRLAGKAGMDIVGALWPRGAHMGRAVHVWVRSTGGGLTVGALGAPKARAKASAYMYMCYIGSGMISVRFRSDGRPLRPLQGDL